MRAACVGLFLGWACAAAAGCRGARLVERTGSATAARSASDLAAAARRGAAPGGDEGPGGFVPRGRARNFYAGAGGRLWYYLNHYYWVPQDVPREDLWVRALVRADFRSLERWPDRTQLTSPPTKSTVEYWAVGAGGRSVRLDNHKDHWTLDPKTCAGAIEVEVTLTLGRVRVRDEQGAWAPPEAAYVLESRNYESNDAPGVGAERTSFEPLPDRPTTVWGYRVPWATAPAPLTRSGWQELRVPTWSLRECLAAPTAPTSDAAAPAPVLTPGEDLPSPAPR